MSDQGGWEASHSTSWLMEVSDNISSAKIAAPAAWFKVEIRDSEL